MYSSSYHCLVVPVESSRLGRGARELKVLVAPTRKEATRLEATGVQGSFDCEKSEWYSSRLIRAASSSGFHWSSTALSSMNTETFTVVYDQVLIAIGEVLKEFRDMAIAKEQDVVEESGRIVLSTS